MTPALLYLPYLPPVSWWMQLFSHHPVYIEHHENFIKATPRNRTVIAGANGVIPISVPVHGGREKRQLYREVRISYQSDWQKVHWQSIRSAYGSAPFFEFYADKISPFYERRFDFLFDFNLSLLETLSAILRVEKKHHLTASYQKNPEGLLDLRKTDDIPCKSLPRYYQVFEERHGFISNLSVLDLLFHLGPESKPYLLKSEC